jgi:hypothetical protein
MNKIDLGLYFDIPMRRIIITTTIFRPMWSFISFLSDLFVSQHSEDSYMMYFTGEYVSLKIAKFI